LGRRRDQGEIVNTSLAVGISLETDCPVFMCRQFYRPLLEQMASGRYDVCSVQPIPPFIEDWRETHRTARKRADRAARRGYRFVTVARHERADELWAINLSAQVRQGRPMTSGYNVRPSDAPLPKYPCRRHAIRDYGVETEDGTLVAYLWLYRAGQLALVSQILGHADHLDREVMYLLFQGVLESESAIDPDGLVVYNRHDSGSDGLRFFKERLGFEPMPVEWLP
jgi:hypothetical protein